MINSNLARCIEDGLENVAIADREIEVDGVSYDCLLATRRVIREAFTDGFISRRERRDIDTHLAVVEAGLLQSLALDVEDRGLGRLLAGRLDGMSHQSRKPLAGGSRSAACGR